MLLSSLTTAFFRHAHRSYQKHDVPLLYNQQEALRTQQECLFSLASAAQDTAYGDRHSLDLIVTGKNFSQEYNFFKALVPLTDYEQMRSYIEQIKQGMNDVLRPGKTKYLSTTSGTTSGKKYIPITPASMRDQMAVGKNAITACFGGLPYEPKMGKMFFLSGSPELSTEGSVVPHGRLSGIVHKETPRFISALAQSPSAATNRIPEFAAKIDAITTEHINHPKSITLLAGIPSYLIQYIELLLEKTGKKEVKELLPNLSMLVIGGVNPAPYKQKLIELLGDGNLPCVETYPASEGFIAYQDHNYPLNQQHNGLLLQTHKGIFFEFIPLEDYQQGTLKEQHRRVRLGEVELNKPYALILNTNAGLRGYQIGDVIEFTSLNPYRIKFAGRTGNFISAFGEHVIETEVQHLCTIAAQHGLHIQEYTVAPQTTTKKGHERFVELGPNGVITPALISTVETAMDEALQEKNEYYRDLRKAGTIDKLCLRVVKPGASNQYMQAQPDFDPQKKFPHLRDNRTIADYFCTQGLVMDL